MTWLPTRTGQPVDLVAPTADQVNFRDMAHALANLNRYAGHGEVQVSVGLHLLIGLDLCNEAVKPYWLLHDGHEERLGEITTPTRNALLAVAREAIGGPAAEVITRTLREFKRRHDAVIHEAAGLPMPSAAIRAAIAEIDARCLAIEHRDFHQASTRSWAHEVAGVKADRSVRRWQSPDKIAEQLLARFERYLPALRPRAVA